MATGFTQRFKGKIAAAELWIGGQDQSSVDAPSTDSTLGAVRTSRIISSSGAGIYTVPRPVPGLDRTISITSVSSGVFLKAASGVSFGVIGGSTMTVMKSTVPMTIELAGLSTSLWWLKSAWSTSTTVIPQPTFSTTT